MARLFGATVAPCLVAPDIAGDSTKVRNRPRRTNPAAVPLFESPRSTTYFDISVPLHGYQRPARSPHHGRLPPEVAPTRPLTSGRRVLLQGLVPTLAVLVSTLVCGHTLSLPQIPFFVSLEQELRWCVSHFATYSSLAVRLSARDNIVDERRSEPTMAALVLVRRKVHCEALCTIK